MYTHKKMTINWILHGLSTKIKKEKFRWHHDLKQTERKQNKKREIGSRLGIIKRKPL